MRVRPTILGERIIYSPVFMKEHSARQWSILFLELAKWMMWIRKNVSQMFYFDSPIQKLPGWSVCFLRIGKSHNAINLFYTLGTWFTGGIRNELTIYLPVSSSEKPAVIVIDELGRIFLTELINSNDKAILNTEDLPAGIYYLRIDVREQIFSGRFLVQRWSGIKVYEILIFEN